MRQLRTMPTLLVALSGECRGNDHTSRGGNARDATAGSARGYYYDGGHYDCRHGNRFATSRRGMGAAAAASFRYGGWCRNRRRREVDCLICILQSERRTRSVTPDTVGAVSCVPVWLNTHSIWSQPRQAAGCNSAIGALAESSPHLLLPGRSIPALVFVHGHHALDTGSALSRGRIRSSEERHMCPACIASTAVMVAGAGSAGGILAVCIGKFTRLFRASRLGLFPKATEK